MKEAFLQYLWRNRMFDFLHIKTTAGESLKIIFPGFPNTDAGPDFKQAIIQIEEVKWAGDVEIHIRSSDWYRHKHQLDEKYKSVALHVVYEHDMDVERLPQELYPTLELKPYIPLEMFERYQKLVDSLDLLSCRGCLDSVDQIYFHSMISTAVMERLLRKQRAIKETLLQCQYDWNETLYRQLAISFGFKTNATAFELLARSLPWKVIVKHADSSLQVSALIFGQAGMLELPHVDAYYDGLKYEYDYLRYKYQLDPIGEYHWNLLRLRPSNFPCVRLGQFAMLLYKSAKEMTQWVQSPTIEYFTEIFSVEADDYWRTHYHFGKPTNQPHSVSLGSTAVHLLLINVVIPMLFAFHRSVGDDRQLEAVVSMLEKLPFENNRRTRLFQGTPFPQKSALDSQALLELLHGYCTEKRCIECGIGEQIVRRPPRDEGTSE